MSVFLESWREALGAGEQVQRGLLNPRAWLTKELIAECTPQVKWGCTGGIPRESRGLKPGLEVSALPLRTCLLKGMDSGTGEGL